MLRRHALSGHRARRPEPGGLTSERWTAALRRRRACDPGRPSVCCSPRSRSGSATAASTPCAACSCPAPGLYDHSPPRARHRPHRWPRSSPRTPGSKWGMDWLVAVVLVASMVTSRPHSPTTTTRRAAPDGARRGTRVPAGGHRDGSDSPGCASRGGAHRSAVGGPDHSDACVSLVDRAAVRRSPRSPAAMCSFTRSTRSAPAVQAASGIVGPWTGDRRPDAHRPCPRARRARAHRAPTGAPATAQFRHDAEGAPPASRPANPAGCASSTARSWPSRSSGQATKVGRARGGPPHWPDRSRTPSRPPTRPRSGHRSGCAGHAVPRGSTSPRPGSPAPSGWIVADDDWLVVRTRSLRGAARGSAVADDERLVAAARLWLRFVDDDQAERIIRACHDAPRPDRGRARRRRHASSPPILTCCPTAVGVPPTRSTTMTVTDARRDTTPFLLPERPPRLGPISRRLLLRLGAALAAGGGGRRVADVRASRPTAPVRPACRWCSPVAGSCSPRCPGCSR